MPPNSGHDAPAQSITDAMTTRTTTSYNILRQHINACKDIPPSSFVSRIVLAHLLEKEKEEATKITSPTTQDTAMTLSSYDGNSNEGGGGNSSTTYYGTNTAPGVVAKDISILRQHVQNCKVVAPTSAVLRTVLFHLDERALQLQSNHTNTNINNTILAPQCRPPPSPQRKSNTQSPPPTPTPKHKHRNTRTTLFRFLLLDTPLSLLFTLTILTHFLHLTYTNYLTPILQTSNWVTPNPTPRLIDEFTYYERQCDTSDVTTRSLDDLKIRDDSDASVEAVETFMTHGAVVMPRLLGEDTAEELREHILKRNGELTADESIPLDGAENRFSYGIGANEHPTVTKALAEVSSSPLLIKSLSLLLGPNPAIAEITAITAQYGAEDQGWHSDVKADGNSVKYSRTFTHSYSLFIPLQNVTKEMGATEICPGTHYCPNDMTDSCSGEFGFPAVPQVGDVGGGDGSVWKVGDALIMNQCMWHRGPAHTDPFAPSRVVFILTFLSRPDPAKDVRQLSHGTYFHIRPDMYGFTLKDLQNPSLRMKAPFSWLRSLGIWKPAGADWGWDWPSMTILRISNEENGYSHWDLDPFLQSHGMAKAIPQFLHGSVKEGEGGGWDGYLSQTTWNFKIASLTVYLLLVGLYFVVAFSWDFASMMRGESTRYCRDMIVRTLVLDLILVGMGYGMYCRLAGTPWVKSVESGIIYKRPFIGRSIVGGSEDYGSDGSDDIITSSSSLPSSLLSLQQHQQNGRRLTTVPEKMDILFSHRFDSKHIGYYRNFLNYHPGNVKFNTDIALQSATFNSYSQISNSFRHRLVKNILDNINQTGARFLYQNDFGEWTTMYPSEVEKLVVKRLLEREHSVFAVLEDELSFLIAGNEEEVTHHGRGGGLRRMAGENLLRWKKVFDEKLMVIGGVVPNDTTIGGGRKIRSERKLRTLSSPHLFRLQPSAVHYPTASLSFTMVRKSQSGTLLHTHHAIKKGDKVHANEGYDSDPTWYVAFVIGVLPNGIVIEVPREDDRRKWRFMTDHKNVRAFRPFTQGDLVDANLEEDDMWYEGIITRAYPDRTYDVVFEWSDDEGETNNQDFISRVTEDLLMATFFDV